MRFYDFASGVDGALRMLYNALPLILSEILDVAPEELNQTPAFNELFDRVYVKHQ